MGKRILIKKSGPYPVPIRRDLQALIHAVSLTVAQVLVFELALDDPRLAGRFFPLSFPAFLTPSSPLTVFLSEVFSIELALDEAFAPSSIKGKSLLVQFGPPDADGHQRIVRWKPLANTQNPNKTEGA
jgi:hypothetical protein